MLPPATVVSSAAPSRADTRFSGADTALGTASVARTTGESCLPGMGPCELRGDEDSQPTACCSHSSGGNLLAL